MRDKAEQRRQDSWWPLAREGGRELRRVRKFVKMSTEQSSSGLGQRAHQRRFVSVASTFGEQRNRGPSAELPPSGRMREGCSTYVWKMYVYIVGGLSSYQLLLGIFFPGYCGTECCATSKRELMNARADSPGTGCTAALYGCTDAPGHNCTQDPSGG